MANPATVVRVPAAKIRDYVSVLRGRGYSVLRAPGTFSVKSGADVFELATFCSVSKSTQSASIMIMHKEQRERKTFDQTESLDVAIRDGPAEFLKEIRHALFRDCVPPAEIIFDE